VPSLPQIVNKSPDLDAICWQKTHTMSSPKRKYFNDEFVQQVRIGLLHRIRTEELKTGCPVKCDQEDVDRMQHDDGWFIRRFLVEKPSTTVQVAIGKVFDAMLWRHKNGINQL